MPLFAGSEWFECKLPLGHPPGPVHEPYIYHPLDIQGQTRDLHTNIKPTHLCCGELSSRTAKEPWPADKDQLAVLHSDHLHAVFGASAVCGSQW